MKALLIPIVIAGVLFLFSEKFREIISPIIAFLMTLFILSHIDSSSIFFVIIIALISHWIGGAFESLYLIGFVISFFLLAFIFMMLTGIKL